MHTICLLIKYKTSQRMRIVVFRTCMKIKSTRDGLKTHPPWMLTARIYSGIPLYTKVLIYTRGYFHTAWNHGFCTLNEFQYYFLTNKFA